MFARIVLLAPPFAVLTYELPEFFPSSFYQPGLRVAAPLGKNNKVSLRAGYIRSIMAESDLPATVACRRILWPLEKQPLLNGETVALATDLARRQGVEEGVIYGHVLPRELRSANVKIRRDGKNIALSETLSLTEDERAKLALDFLSERAWIMSKRRDAGDLEMCVWKADPPWPVRPAAKRQLEILGFMYEHGSLSRNDLLKKTGASVDALNRLVKCGLVELRQENAGEFQDLLPPPPAQFSLNEEQTAAIESLKAAFDDPGPQARLLYGVTGSGKTAVYIELVKYCARRGKSAFVLAPEVALAYKLCRDLKYSLPHLPLCFYHGYQPPHVRAELFADIARQTGPSVVVGTRSALFLPVFNPGCIILDEEHDASFKQDEIFAYHAKEVAWFRMQYQKGLLTLGSATPDIKTFYAACQGALPVLEMRKRASGNSLPTMELVDIGGAGAGTLAASSEGAGLLSTRCEDELLACLGRGEQAVILLNRRGYSPMIYCVNCSKILRCPHCEIGLAYHKSLHKLVCHYCGYSVPYPSPCPDCGKAAYLSIGEGTERIAERLESLAGRPVLRLDRDSARRPGRMEEILASFGRNESPFLVGTQMLSKGHHFPNVTLAVVADGDIGLNLPDYRAAERTFQLLVQSAGRAGRGEKPGHVLIQTRNTRHYCWQYVINSDYEGFYADELARRKKRLYPPFTRLALLRLSFPFAESDGFAAIQDLAQNLRLKAKSLGIQMLGPAPAPVAMLRGRKRYQILFKSGDWGLVRQAYHFALNLPASRKLRLFLDLDPVSML